MYLYMTKIKQGAIHYILQKIKNKTVKALKQFKSKIK